MEPLKNGQVNQQIRRRPLRAVATSRTTDGFSHSHSFGLRDSQSSPKNRRSSYQPTPNDYHDNSSPNDTNGITNSAAASSLLGRGKAVSLGTAWELPDLIKPLHRPATRVVAHPRSQRHYPAMVEFVYNHRFAMTLQLQRQFNYYLRNLRTTQYQLARLVDLGYLQRAPVRSTSPNFPHVYAATRRGLGLIQQTYADHGVAWHGIASEQLKPTGVSLDSILHEVSLTEFDQAVQATVESRGDISRLLHERRYFRRDNQLRYESDGKIHRLIPDAGFLLRYESWPNDTPAQQPRLQLNLVEFDNGTLSTARSAAKFEAYNLWSRSDRGQHYIQRLYERYGKPNQPPNFRLLVIAQSQGNDNDDQRLAELFTVALELPQQMRERIWLTTVKMLRLHQRDLPPLAAPLWLRVRDARSWLPEMAKLTGDRVNIWQRNKRSFVAKNLSTLPHHTLFPRSKTLAGVTKFRPTQSADAIFATPQHIP